MKKSVTNQKAKDNSKALWQHVVIASAITDFFISVRATQGLLSPIKGNVGFRILFFSKIRPTLRCGMALAITGKVGEVADQEKINFNFNK